jgi:UPF0042 nucleotide-binding protein
VSTPRRRADVDVAIITGLSGAGRSEAAKALEDLGWFVVDNLPPTLIKTMVLLALAPGNNLTRIALVIDARGGAFFTEAMEELERLRRDVCDFRLLFLEASDEALVRRFDANRRRHPLAIEEGVAVGIQRERDLMRAFREGADLIIDTSEFSVRDLRTRIGPFFEATANLEELSTTVLSFGYKFGLPLDADIVLDVRFLPNPHWVPGLRELTGTDTEVRDYVLEQEGAQEFLSRVRDLFAVLLPGYQEEGRHYLTVAVGCTGGRHRSIVLADEIASMIKDKGFAVRVVHRDIERNPSPR